MSHWSTWAIHNWVKPSLISAVFFTAFSSFLVAQEYHVSSVDELSQSLNTAVEGDAIFIAKGVYAGHFEINSAITVQGESGSVIDAQGTASAIVVKSNGVNIANLTIQNWGDDLTLTDAGIKATGVNGLTITNITLQGDGFGIYLQSVGHAKILSNVVHGNPEKRSSDRGNGIHLIDVTHSLVAQNQVMHTRDGLYIINSQENDLRDNHMSQLRFGVHYMYSHSNRVQHNTATDVKVGYALMSSERLTINSNTAVRCEDYGLLLNFVNDSVFQGNDISYVKRNADQSVSGDEGKALFIYNSSNNKITENRFAHSNMGIHLTAGSENNEIFGNDFIQNEVQVKYVSTRQQEWSRDQRGNYWSNYLGWDLDNNGVGDTAFEPNDGVDKLIWKYPEAKVLMDSPAVLLLRWVQRSFPVLKSPGVTDSYPLLVPSGESI